MEQNLLWSLTVAEINSEIIVSSSPEGFTFCLQAGLAVSLLRLSQVWHCLLEQMGASTLLLLPSTKYTPCSAQTTTEIKKIVACAPQTQHFPLHEQKQKAIQGSRTSQSLSQQPCGAVLKGLCRAMKKKIQPKNCVYVSHHGSDTELWHCSRRGHLMCF